MATMRRYKPKGYFRGGRVLDDMPIEGDAPTEAGGFPAGILGDHLGAGAALQDGTVPRSPPPPAETSLATDQDNPLQRALDAQRRADELQQSTLDREIGKLPLSEFKKAFLRQHPDLITDQFRSRATAFYYQAALKEGIEDDTPEMNAAILAGVEREIANVRWQAIENVRMPQAEPEPEPDHVAPRAMIPPVPAAPAPAPPARRSIPMSAPVSRDAPTYTGRAQSESVGITLSAEERDIARRSYSAPDMTDAQKEYAYAKAKQRLKRLRQSGEYPDRETN